VDNFSAKIFLEGKRSFTRLQCVNHTLKVENSGETLRDVTKNMKGKKWIGGI